MFFFLIIIFWYDLSFKEQNLQSVTSAAYLKLIYIPACYFKSQTPEDPLPVFRGAIRNCLQ